MENAPAPSDANQGQRSPADQSGRGGQQPGGGQIQEHGPQIVVEQASPRAGAPAENAGGGEQGDPSAAAAQPKDKRKEEDKTIAKPTEYIDRNKFVARQRSNLLTMNDRHQLEQDILKPIESGGGIFGVTKIDLNEKKKKVLDIKDIPQGDALIDLLQADGIFVDRALEYKSQDINVQKLEERLLNNGQK